MSLKMKAQAAGLRCPAKYLKQRLLAAQAAVASKVVGKPRISPHASALVLAIVILFVACPRCQSLRTFPPLHHSIFVNGSITSLRCQCMYSCSLSTQDVQQCSCHPFCYLFDTCCADVRPANWRQLALPEEQFTCAPPVPWAWNVYDFQPNHDNYRHNTGSLIVNRCPQCSNSSCYVEQLCQHPLELTQDGLLSLPVTANRNGVTYRNIFCAFCHGESLSDVSEWTPVIITFPVEYGGDSVRAGFRSPFSVPIHDCRRNHVRHCSSVNATLSDRDACESNPTAHVYANYNSASYRNWNCSKCNDDPANFCMDQRMTVDYWWQNTPTASATAIERDWRCPGRLEAFMSPAEQQFWLSRCPALQLPDPSCTSFVNAAELSRLFAAETEGSATAASAPSSADYGLASDYAWLRRGNGSNSSVVCSSCQTQYYPTLGLNSNGAAGANVGYDAFGWNASDAQLTVGGITYSRPFFTTQTAACYVVICDEQQPRAYTGNWTPTRDCSSPPIARAATAAAVCNSLPVWQILVGVAVTAAR